MKLEELIKNGFGLPAHYTDEERERYRGVKLNCCEQIVRGANQAYRLGLDDNALKVSAAFGGGMGIGSVCGAVTGGLMVLSLICCPSTEKATPFKDEVVKPFIERARAELGDIECSALKPRYTAEPPYTCELILLKVSRILDEAAAKAGLV